MNNALANYSSAWDIDQILLPDPIPVSMDIAASPDGGSTPATAISTYTHGLGYLPVVEATYQAPGKSTWHQCGLPDGFILSSWGLNIAGQDIWPGMIETNGVGVAYGFDENTVTFNGLNYNTSPQTVLIRLHLWGDKIDYA